MFLEWSSIYSVSNFILDAQRKQIIKLMNDLHSVVSNNTSGQVVTAIFVVC